MCFSEFIDIKVFIRVYRLEKANFFHTFSRYFQPSCVICTLPLLLFSLVQLSLTRLLPCVNKYAVYTYPVYKGGRYRVLSLRQLNTFRKVP
jgi:hypothetical protein